ncbi:hypothetical protein, partial [Enterobacter hormaechei]
QPLGWLGYFLKQLSFNPLVSGSNPPRPTNFRGTFLILRQPPICSVCQFVVHVNFCIFVSFYIPALPRNIKKREITPKLGR